MCVAKPVHVNMLSSCLCISLKPGCEGLKVNACKAGLCVPVEACTYVHRGCVCPQSGGGAVGKNTSILHYEAFGDLVTLRGEETESDNS